MAIQNVDTSPAAADDPGIGTTKVYVDTSAISWAPSGVITLPATPQDGSRIQIKDEGGSAFTKPIVVDGNGNNIDGQATRTIQNPFEALLVAYEGTHWAVI